MDIVLEVFFNFGCFGWFIYNEGFSQKLSVCPSLKWGVKDVGLWLKLLLSQKPVVRNSTPNPALRKGMCFAFNEALCK